MKPQMLTLAALLLFAGAMTACSGSSGRSEGAETTHVVYYALPG